MSQMSLRRTWFQVHKWIGLILAILVIPLSLTGAALVWDEALDRALNPSRYAVSGAATVAVDRYVEAARAVAGRGEVIASLRMPEDGGPVIVQAVKPGPARGGPPQRTTVYLDPPTARVLATNDGGGLMRTFHMIHGSLMVPGVGRQIVGWIGVAMMLSALTGLWLWWPSVGRWTRGFRWRRQPNVDANLHHLFGFWIALPLFVLSLTGAWISFPAFFGAIGGGAGAPRPAGRPQPIADTRMTAGEAIARASVAPDAVRQIVWPTDKKPDWTLTIDGGSVGIADATGVAARQTAERESVARLMRRIHDGTGMGRLWQVIIFLGGLIPAGLAVTGIIMWWRARTWRSAVKARQRTARVPAE